MSCFAPPLNHRNDQAAKAGAKIETNIYHPTNWKKIIELFFEIIPMN